MFFEQCRIPLFYMRKGKERAYDVRRFGSDLRSYLKDLGIEVQYFDPLSGNKIKENIINQIDQPVKWMETIVNMKNDGFKNFIEVGPKNILTNFNKKIIPNLNTINSDSLIKGIA